jgi:hypothetical protein
MATQTFTVTHPDGEQETRTSKTRVYTHAVVLVVDDPEPAAAALDAEAAKTEAKAAAVVGDDTLKERLLEIAANQRARAAERRAAGCTYSTWRWSSTEAAAVKATVSGDLAKCVAPGERLVVVPVDAA